MPKGYWIGRVTVTDPAAYNEYRARNAVAFAKYGGRFVVRGPGTCVLGEARAHNVVLEFPTIEAARACYESPEYQAAKPFVLKGCDVDLVIVEGYEGPQPA